MGAVTLPRLIALALAFVPAVAVAHHPGATVEEGAWRWNLDPWLMGLLLVSVAVYARGARDLARRAGPGRGIGRFHKGCFAAGMLLLAAALLSPLDTLGERLFWVHMVQHEVLMALAAPLLVLSRPLEAFAWAAPRACGALARPLQRMSQPLAAWALHAIAIWAWHVPAFFNLALADSGVHAVQHACFLVTGLAFWHSLWRHTGSPREGVALLALFTTMAHMAALGALLTFSAAPWYDFPSPQSFGLTALEDQQLGGLVMSVPGGLPYVAAALAILGRYIGSERGGAPQGALSPPPGAMRAPLAGRRKHRGTNPGFGPRPG
jgi:putative membrane protein